MINEIIAIHMYTIAYNKVKFTICNDMYFVSNIKKHLIYNIYYLIS